MSRITRRLKPLYQGADPLASSVSVGGVRIVLIDNSLYHVTPGVVAGHIRRHQVAEADGRPMVTAPANGKGDVLPVLITQGETSGCGLADSVICSSKLQFFVPVADSRQMI